VVVGLYQPLADDGARSLLTATSHGEAPSDHALSSAVASEDKEERTGRGGGRNTRRRFNRHYAPEHANARWGGQSALLRLREGWGCSKTLNWAPAPGSNPVGL